jgi:hypothetical protein
MMGSLKSVTLGDSILEGLKSLILEFNNLPAVQADQMVMMPSFRNRFISGLPVPKFSLGGQAETGEKFQGAVYSNIANFRIDFGNLSIDLGKALMPR